MSNMSIALRCLFVDRYSENDFQLEEQELNDLRVSLEDVEHLFKVTISKKLHVRELLCNMEGSCSVKHGVIDHLLHACYPGNWHECVDLCRHLHFDFHRICGHVQFERLSILYEQIEDFLMKNRYYLLSEKGEKVEGQIGIVRTNYVDCLDHTNVTQAYLLFYPSRQIVCVPKRICCNLYMVAFLVSALSIQSRQTLDIHQKVPLVSGGVRRSIPWMEPGLPRGKGHMESIKRFDSSQMEMGGPGKECSEGMIVKSQVVADVIRDVVNAVCKTKMSCNKTIMKVKQGIQQDNINYDNHMARELDATLDSGEASPVGEDNAVSFLAHVVQPIYDTLSKLQQDSSAKEAETESNVGTMGQRTSILLAEETLEDEEEDYLFVKKYPNFQEEPNMLVEEKSCPVYDTDNEEEESMPVYDTDIQDVIEEEEGFVGKGGFGGEEDNIEDVVVVANDLCSLMIQTILSVDFEEDINTKSHELMLFGKNIIIKVS
ncbi:11-beta-hydroxysteroid dehydrogenase 1B-like protein [Tanacetum coccineum]|uniref:11-beta-hydroxysteroid dehydrogenase 1B-like protein n=1 Tax=Tanacetum coccineum TaxID=301880 RepID=A0ABQ5FA83_9ASTR